MTLSRGLGRRVARRAPVVLTVVATVAAAVLAAPPSPARAAAHSGPAVRTQTAAPPTAARRAPGAPDLGPNVHVFDPSMPVSEIQATVDAIAAQQVTNQFGSE